MAETAARISWPGIVTVLGITSLLVSTPASTSAREAEVLSRAGQLREVMKGQQRSFVPVRLEGTVLYVDSKRHLLALQDSSGIVVLDCDLTNQTFRPGYSIVLEGNCAVEAGTLSFGHVPVVNNDGQHSSTEKTGSAFLRAGRHPLRLAWFDCGGDVALEVSYEGPDLERQKIPVDRLYHTARHQNGPGMEWVPGLEYKDYQGDWFVLPNFSELVPSKQGVAAGFDLSVRSRTNQVGLEFSGYLDVAKEGTYTFWINSDDGSQLFIDDAAGLIRVARTNGLPAARSLSLDPGSTREPLWSQLEGKIVFAGHQPEGWTMELSLKTGERIDLELPDDAGNAPEGWLHSQVRVTGVLERAASSEGVPQLSKLLVPGIEQVLLLQPGGEPWARPALSVGQLANGQELSGATVHVRGRVQSILSDFSLIVADETGQLEVETSQPLERGLDGSIELLGRCERVGTGTVLRGSVYRRLGAANGTGEMLPILNTIEQIHRLKREEAGRGYPVLIRGVVTCSWNWNPNGMIQDATRGIFLPNLAPGSPARVGDYLEVQGYTAAGDFAPVINSTQVTLLGKADLPEPLRPAWDQLLNGSLDCQFVELEGVVTSVQTNGFTLRMCGGRVAVEIDGWDGPELKRFENSRVRVRGALSAVWDGQTHQVVSGKIYLHTVAISVEEAAPADLFVTPAKQIDELRQFDAQAGSLQRVKLAGQIVHQRGSEYFLTDGTNGLRFHLAHEQPLHTGDLVEVVGFPETDGPSARLLDAMVLKTGRAALPTARLVTSSDSLESTADATLVQMQGRVSGARLAQGELVMELRDGPRHFVARLAGWPEAVSWPAVGSRVRLTGVYSAELGAQDALPADSFELLLNSMSDIVVLQRPSWWSAGHALGVAAVLAAILLLALGWIGSLRQTVEQRTAELQAEIEHHKRTEAEVKDKARLLAVEIEERKRAEQEVERVHKQLLLTSRQAGMTEVATSILHNVGNVLNSVNVSASVIAEKLRQSKAPRLLRVADLLADGAACPDFLAADGKGRQVPGYLKSLGERLKSEQEGNLQELGNLQNNIEHIKRIVAMQQDYARLGGLVEKIRLSEVIEDSIRINANALARHGVKLVRDFQVNPELLVEKHKVLQILVNLIQNAKTACVEGQPAQPQVLVSIQPAGAERVKISVADNGMGISLENLKRIFTPGFTTRKDGHGFGLHGSILAAKELHGDLSVHSQGPGRGATFILELPLADQNSSTTG